MNTSTSVMYASRVEQA